jgi:hypothetical protein
LRRLFYRDPLDNAPSFFPGSWNSHVYALVLP